MGYSILKPSPNVKLDDVRALGALLVNLKEPGTGGRNPGTLELEKPGEVSNICQNFIKKTATSSAESLLEVRKIHLPRGYALTIQHEFLMKSPGVGRMRIFIYRAMECARRNSAKMPVTL